MLTRASLGAGYDGAGPFADARLHVVPDATLFCHEEKPADVARALLPVLQDGS